jgi:hypothetical protein
MMWQLDQPLVEQQGGMMVIDDTTLVTRHLSGKHDQYDDIYNLFAKHYE